MEKMLRRRQWGMSYRPVEETVSSVPKRFRKEALQDLEELIRDGWVERHKNGACVSLDPSRKGKIRSFLEEHGNLEQWLLEALFLNKNDCLKDSKMKTDLNPDGGVMRMEENPLLSVFGTKAVLKIADVLLTHPSADYSKKELAEAAGISEASVHRNWEAIEKAGLVRKTRSFGNTDLYAMEQDSKVMRKLFELDQELRDRLEEVEEQEEIVA